MSNTNGGRGPRTVALVGPYGSGKTTLLESMLFATEAVPRKGTIAQKNTVGDSSPEARARQMSVEINCATTRYLDETFTFLDCPGSIEFLQDALYAIQGVDAAIVVIEPEPAKVQMLKPYLKRLADLKIPHVMFVNKIDKANGSLRDILSTLQEASDLPLLLRQIPIWENEVVTGFVDLALERAFAYRDHAPSQAIDIADKDREKEARFTMLEKLADYDEHLMEELLSDVEPPREEVFGDLKREFADCLVVPVLIGSAEGDHGIRRLLKALRHETPDVATTAARLGIPTNGDTIVQVLKTVYSAHGGKLSLSRVMNGALKDGAVLHNAEGRDVRVGGIFALKGEAATKLTDASVGDTVALVRMEDVATGDTLSSAKIAPPKPEVEQLPPVYRLAIEAADRKDEVKLTAAIGKLIEEDPSLHFEQSAELHEMALAGQGEIHLKVAVEKLMSKYGLKLNTRPASVPYKETIRRSVTQRGRHKRQSGGHGQFGDVVIEIKPLPRGAGFTFVDEIVGGVVPKQWIPSVEKGVVEYLKCGPLGFPVVDVCVTLTDGSYHTVDSSDAAFQTAARIGMQEGMPECSPVLLEPIMHVRIHVPSEATAKVNAVVSGRRGQLMGFDVRPGWKGWDTVEAEMPQSELGNLIIDLRSLTQGVGTFEMVFDHLAELTGKTADHVVATHKADKAAA
ncbi:MAG: elongation factor G [Alphaproteobacteria bacterium]|nr:elongation factor G [Alphaproteobacteria bacterium]MDE2163732.1 elongation factor G [Alphaproteobacteria bacterium]MDE2499405.1 elongation factor G [Alphaproteobacteria bacterium]